MSVQRETLATYLEQCLEPARFADYCPNGLQVEGSKTITKLATGVTACREVLDAAAAWQADAVLVHHGYFWRGEQPEIVGLKRRRLHTLLTHEMNLFAYHLPLDAHPEFGNNARLGELLGMSAEKHSPLEAGVDNGVGSIASLPQAISCAELVQRLHDLTSRPPLHIGDAQRQVRRIAWCTGAAQGYIEQAVVAGADVYITGEISEQTVHIAREEGIEFIAAGHHATERYGVQALGEHLAEKFALEYRYFEVDNPA